VGASNETVAVPAKPTQDAHKPSTIRCPAAAATLPTDIPGFAQLSGCLRAIEGLSSAQKAARQALAVATAAAIARVMERAGCKASQIEVSCASTTSGVGAPEGDSTTRGSGSAGSGSIASSSGAPKHASRSVERIDNCSEERAPAQPSQKPQRSDSRSKHRGIFLPHVGIFSHKGTWVCPSKVAPRISQGLNDAGAERQGSTWGSQIHVDMPEGASGRSGITAVLSSMPSPRVVARRNMRPGSGAQASQLHEAAASEVAAMPQFGRAVAGLPICEAAATDLDKDDGQLLPSLDEVEASCGFPCQDEIGIPDYEGSCMTSCGEGMGNLLEIAQAELQAQEDGIDDADTLTGAETAEPSERSLHNDESMASLLSMQSFGSMPTTGAYSCTGTVGSAMDIYGEDNSEVHARGSLQSASRKHQTSDIFPMRPAGQPPEVMMFGMHAPRPPGQMSKKLGAAEPFLTMKEPLTALKALYGRRVPRPWSSSRPMSARQISSRPLSARPVSARLGTPRTPPKPRTPRMTGVPFGRRPVQSPHTPMQMARRMEMHLSGACEGSRCGSKDTCRDQEVHAFTERPSGKLPPLSSSMTFDDGLPTRSALAHVAQTSSTTDLSSTATTPRAAPVVFSAEACISVPSAPSDFKHAQRRRSSVRLASRYRLPLGVGLPDYAYAPKSKDSPRNTECPFSQNEIEEGVVLCCGHRFSLEHLGIAAASSQYENNLSGDYLVCPLCGDAQRYGPEVYGRLRPTTIYSDNKRAYVGNILDNNWDSVTTLPMNV